MKMTRQKQAPEAHILKCQKIKVALLTIKSPENRSKTDSRAASRPEAQPFKNWQYAQQNLCKINKSCIK